MTLTGLSSGYLQEAVGYQWFFVIVLAASIPSIFFTRVAPFHNVGQGEKAASAH
jgi:hypothetical protein